MQSMQEVLDSELGRKIKVAYEVEAQMEIKQTEQLVQCGLHPHKTYVSYFPSVSLVKRQMGNKFQLDSHCLTLMSQLLTHGSCSAMQCCIN